MEAISREINIASAQLARTAADEFSTPERPRFVAGILGPTSRTASLSPDVNDPGARNVTFDELVENYIESTHALIEGGVDDYGRDYFRYLKCQSGAVCGAAGV